MKSGYARTTILVAAAIMAIGAIVLGYLYFSGQSKQMAVVIVAAEDISANTVISSGMIRVVSIQEDAKRPDAATDLAGVVQKVAIAPVKKGEQIVLTNLVDKGTAFGLAAIIPPGTRAMTITVDATDTVSEFLQPGNHVDIIATLTDGSNSVARLILQDVVLLAVDSNIQSAAQRAQKQPLPAESTRVNAARVTIAVTPSQAEMLVAAQQRGKLKVVLRGVSDSSRFATKGTSTNRIFGIKEAQHQTAKSVQPAKRVSGTQKKTLRKSTVVRPMSVPTRPGQVAECPPGLALKKNTITVIKGNQVEEVEVDN
ncbi:Flp pilus assembly protein CpaB [bacterium]|nr:Flp pilus assembly protein CpaB [bacterium]